MRLVIDTNVLVSALLNAGRVPDRAVVAVRERGDVVLYDGRIEDEYREVLARPKFRAIEPSRIAELLDAVLVPAFRLAHVPPWSGAMIDPGDLAFVEVALAGQADAIVTGNPRHYPQGLGFEVLLPAVLLARIAPDRRVTH